MAELVRGELLRAPDVAFARQERLPPGAVSSPTLKVAPDLAAEILSPSETASRLDEKLNDYAASHIPLVWVIDRKRRTVMVVDADAPIRARLPRPNAATIIAPPPYSSGVLLPTILTAEAAEERRGKENEKKPPRPLRPLR